MVRLNSVPESYVPTDEIREARALVRGRQSLVEHRTEYANKIHGLLSDHGDIANRLNPWGESLPLKSAGDDSLRSGAQWQGHEDTSLSEGLPSERRASDDKGSSSSPTVGAGAEPETGGANTS
jgi:hypothetical protein